MISFNSEGKSFEKQQRSNKFSNQNIQEHESDSIGGLR